MVRNIASMQSIRGSIDDMSAERPRLSFQTERRAWNVEPTTSSTNATAARSSPSIQNLVQPAETSEVRNLADETLHARMRELDRQIQQQESPPYQAKLMLLERQNLQRLAEARAQLQSPLSPTSSDGSHQAQDEDPAVSHDSYLAQLFSLERQNKRRLALARAEQRIDPDGSQQAQAEYQYPCATLAELQASLYDSTSRERGAPRDEQQRFKQATRENAAAYTKPFCDFLTDNPTVFHAVDAMKKDLKDAGFTQLSERDAWKIESSGKYFVERNGSSLIAFVVGAQYEPGNGAAILAGHIDALTAKLKPVSQVPNKAGYLQLGVAPYAGGLGRTWWDRDLGVGGRVHIKEGDKIVTKLVKLDWPIAKIPSLAEHFGAPAAGPFNKETQMVPIIGLDTAEERAVAPLAPVDPFAAPPLLRSRDGLKSFVNTQPPALVKAIGSALGLSSNETHNIINWELELFDVQPATVLGLNKELISAGRIDDKLCSWAALQALIESEASDTKHSSLIKVVGLFDDEEIGSLLRQGAKGNFLPITLERAVGALAGHTPGSDLMGRTYANSFMVSSDVTHAVNPNFTEVYLANHAPHLNVGVAIAADSNGHMTTDSVSTTILKRCADKVGAQLQVFQIRNDSRSGGTVGPMLSSAMGVRAIDAGLAQLSMHSIRATTGALDPGLGVLMFTGFLNGFEEVDREFQE
ncbi:Putative peptidase M18 [Septoria linicola]|uniref:Peptidase M18 n=1 Tax=Septoria linicola TaxID=215465 RepID=A0A9Q9EGL1_9PEZI|nr:putative peptidase M18 [Septoria linicola]USW50926.1 Putative peptidase M18 [Septoria linicola]